MRSLLSTPNLAAGALAVAAMLAPWGLAPIAAHPPDAGTSLVDFVRSLEPLRARLGVGARVRMIYPGDDEAPGVLAQYALAPATVARVRPEECFQDGASCAANATHLLLLLPPSDFVLQLGAQLGFAPEPSPPGMTLLTKARR